jgi:hypothetical protein
MFSCLWGRQGGAVQQVQVLPSFLTPYGVFSTQTSLSAKGLALSLL